MFNFEKFSNEINQKKVEIVEDLSAEAYTYLCMWNLMDVEDIDFNKLTVDAITAAAELQESITHEDEAGLVYLDPNHSASLVNGFGHKMHALESMERLRVPSLHRFI